MTWLQKLSGQALLVAFIGLTTQGAYAVPFKASTDTNTPADTDPLGLESVFSRYSAAPSRFRERLDEGIKALKQGALESANMAFKEASTLEPHSALSYLGLAEVAGRQGNNNDVESWLEKAYAEEPSNAEVLRTLGRYRLVQGNAAAAEDIIKKALAQDPKSVTSLLLLGDTYLNGLKRPEKAEAIFRQALQLDSSNVGGTMGLATSLAAQGKVDQALKMFAQASRLAPNDPMPVHSSARLLASQTKLDAAINAMDKTIAIDRTFLPAYIDKGDLYMLKGDFKRAVATYQAATSEVRDPALAYFKLAVAFQAQQKWDPAERNYLEAIKRDPRMFGAYNNLAWISALRKVHLDDALIWANKAVAISPKNAPLYDTLGSVHMARGEIDKAISAISKAVALDPKRPDFYYRLGLAYKQLGKLSEAKSAFKQALAVGSKFPEMDDARKQLRALGDR